MLTPSASFSAKDHWLVSHYWVLLKKIQMEAFQGGCVKIQIRNLSGQASLQGYQCHFHLISHMGSLQIPVYCLSILGADYFVELIELDEE